MIKRYILILAASNLMFGCMKDSKTPTHEKKEQIITTAKGVLLENGIPPDRFPVTHVASVGNEWVVTFSEPSPHPPGSDVTVLISKKDGTSSFIKGE